MSNVLNFWTACLLVFTSFSISITNQRCASTHFSCANVTGCVPLDWRCDGTTDCPDGSDELDCPSNPCSGNEFMCANRKCIPGSWKCDGEPDCGRSGDGDASDESIDVCGTLNCSEHYRQCGTRHKCIPEGWFCDGQIDCPGDEDERDCRNACTTYEFDCSGGNGTSNCIHERWRCDGTVECPGGADERDCPPVRCRPGQRACETPERGSFVKRCIPLAWFCDGDPDCGDASDEDVNYCHGGAGGAGSTLAPPVPCPSRDDVRCATGSQCIHASWTCDGDEDCADGSDERNCDPQKACNTCMALRVCIPESKMCDGNPDCDNLADELNCSKPRQCDPLTEFSCASSGQCVSLARVCDGVRHCWSGEDEAPLDNPACSDAGWSGRCRPSTCGGGGVCRETRTGAGFYCDCPAGRELRTPYPNHCQDIDECAATDLVCSHECVNTPGSYECRCAAGYLKHSNNQCKAVGNRVQIMFGYNKDIRKFDIAHDGQRFVTNHLTSLLNDSGSAVAVAYDIFGDSIFWSDVINEKVMMRRNIKSAHAQTVELFDAKSPTLDGLTFDWIGRHLYWTDYARNRIMSSTVDGDTFFQRIVIDSELEEPRAICVDPLSGYIYWTDWGSKPKIERAPMIGGRDLGPQRRTLVDGTRVVWPNGLALDLPASRLYWADAKTRQIGTVRTDGTGVKVVIQMEAALRHPFALDVFEERLFWTDWQNRSIHVANKLTGVVQSEPLLVQSNTPNDIVVFHPLKQPASAERYPCLNARCSHFCIPLVKELGKSKFRCVCPIGMLLQSDRRTCKTPLKPDAAKAFLPEPPPTPETPAGEPVTPARHTASSSLPVGQLTGIVAGVLTGVGVFVALIVYLLVNYYRTRNYRVKFDNPIYRRESGIHLSQSMEELMEQKQPRTLAPLTEGAETEY